MQYRLVLISREERSTPADEQEVGWAPAKTIADAARSIAEQLDPYPDAEGEPSVMIPLSLLEKLLLTPRSEITDQQALDFMKGIWGQQDKP